MTIESIGDDAGVNVHLDSRECELLVRLARDAAAAPPRDHPEADSYFSVSLRLGQQIDEALNSAAEQRAFAASVLTERMVGLILGDSEA